MLDIIIKAIFFIVGKIGDIILLPIMALVNVILPGITVNLDNIFNYLEMGFSYVPFFFKSLLIPNICIQLVVLVFTTYVSFIVSVRVYTFVMKLYTKFKP